MKTIAIFMAVLIVLLPVSIADITSCSVDAEDIGEEGVSKINVTSDGNISKHSLWHVDDNVSCGNASLSEGEPPETYDFFEEAPQNDTMYTLCLAIGDNSSNASCETFVFYTSGNNETEGHGEVGDEEGAEESETELPPTDDEGDDGGGSSMLPWLLGGAGLLGLLGLGKMLGNRVGEEETNQGCDGGDCGESKPSDYKRALDHLPNIGDRLPCKEIYSVKDSWPETFSLNDHKATYNFIPAKQDVNAQKTAKKPEELKKLYTENVGVMKGWVGDWNSELSRIDIVTPVSSICNIHRSGSSWTYSLNLIPDPDKWFFECDAKFCTEDAKIKASGYPGPCEDYYGICEGKKEKGNQITGSAIEDQEIKGQGFNLVVHYSASGPFEELYDRLSGSHDFKYQNDNQMLFSRFSNQREGDPVAYLTMYDFSGEEPVIKDVEIRPGEYGFTEQDFADKGKFYDKLSSRIGDRDFGETVGFGSLKPMKILREERVCGKSCCEIAFGKDYQQNIQLLNMEGSGRYGDKIAESCSSRPNEESASGNNEKGCCEIVQDKRDKDLNEIKSEEISIEVEKICSSVVEGASNTDTAELLNDKADDKIKKILIDFRKKCLEINKDCIEGASKCAQNGYKMTERWIKDLDKKTGEVPISEIRGKGSTENSVREWKKNPGCYPIMDKERFTREQFEYIGTDCPGDLLRINYVNEDMEPGFEETLFDNDNPWLSCEDNWVIGERKLSLNSMKFRIESCDSSPVRYGTLDFNKELIAEKGGKVFNRYPIHSALSKWTGKDTPVGKYYSKAQKTFDAYKQLKRVQEDMAIVPPPRIESASGIHDRNPSERI